MITLKLPASLTEVNQSLFGLAWKLKNMGAESSLISDKIAYTTADKSIFDKATIQEVINAGGEIENLPLFIEIALVDEVPTSLGGGTWAEYVESPIVEPLELEGKIYIEAINGAVNHLASVVVNCGLPYKTTAEIQAMQMGAVVERPL